MPTADDAEEFKEEWNNRLDELVIIGHSLPEEELNDFLDELNETKERMGEFIDKAAEHTYED